MVVCFNDMSEGSMYGRHLNCTWHGAWMDGNDEFVLDCICIFFVDRLILPTNHFPGIITGGMNIQ